MNVPKTQLVDFLYSQGFDEVKVTSAEPPESFCHYQEWLDKGLQADLDYMAREDRLVRRKDPQLLLPGAKSIILVGISFGEIDMSGNDDRDMATVSVYARRPDYHKIIDKKLKKTAKLLQREFGEQARFSVDYGAVLERDLAQRAGMGYIGKSTMLINEKMGTSFFIGEIITTLELEPDDDKVGLKCGACQNCIKICPTGALKPYEVDTAKCISYLTIEYKGAIPEKLRSRMGNRIFGCDICQHVCPQNSRRLPQFSPSESEKLRDFWSVDTEMAAKFHTLGELNLADLIKMDEEKFSEFFDKTPVKRAGYECFMRNVAVALGNSKNPQNIPCLEEKLGQISPLVDEHIDWALARLRS